MQEQEGERRGVGEKNKRRMGDERGCELERKREREKEEKSTESNVAEKGTQRAQAWNRREREKERETRKRNKKEISRIFYIRGYPRLILMRLRKKQNPIIKECEGYNRKEAKTVRFIRLIIFYSIFSNGMRRNVSILMIEKETINILEMREKGKR